MENKKNFKHYVGPEERYDILSSMQFNLLTSLGLRDHHKVLDFGCGSLRLGRLLIPYLNIGNYYGIDPNKWLIDDGIKNHLGKSIIKIKTPHFSFNDDYKIYYKSKFHFIIAQSILSHTSFNLSLNILNNFQKSLLKNGIIVLNFKIKNYFFSNIFRRTTKSNSIDDWIYPKCTLHSEYDVSQLAKKCNLHYKKLSYFHPTLTWYIFVKDKDILRSKIFNNLAGDILGVNI